MIPTIELDDRKYDDIKEEATRLIPRYCPDWTNRNISDPGMTLLSLFSWMTEMTLHRINKIPVKTYIALLDMLGFTLKPPKCASTILQFYINPNRTRDVAVKKGVQVGSVGTGGPPIIFESENGLTVRNISLSKVINRDGEKWEEINKSESGSFSSFLLFDSQNSVVHELYFETAALTNLILGHTLELEFETGRDITSQKDEFISYIKWEYYNGESWVSYSPSYTYYKAEDKPNTVYFSGINDIAPVALKQGDPEKYYLKAVLVDYPDMSVAGTVNPFSIRALKLKLLYTGDGFEPDSMMRCSRGMYSAIDQGNVFMIFSEKPAYDEAFYLANEDIFTHPGLKVELDFTLSEMNSGDMQANSLAEFPLEYYNGDRWCKVVTGYEDGTQKFMKSGKIKFIVPDDIAQVTVNGMLGCWLRIRLISQNLGVGGHYEMNEMIGIQEWVFDAQVQSPLFERLRIGYEPFERYFENVIQYSNFKWKEFPYLCERHESKRETVLLDIDREELPSLYLGFSREVSVGTFPVYFKVDEITKDLSLGSSLSGMLADPSDEDKVSIEWQIWDGVKWENISVTDTTNGFRESGFINFASEGNMKPLELFGSTLHWIRAVKVNGNFDRVPTVKSILLNCVRISNASTHTNEVLSSYNSATRSYSTSYSDILPGIDIVVKEGGKPSNEEIQVMAREGVKECYIEDEDGEIWVRYKEVPNLYNSNSFSRHFVVNYESSEIIFGDGTNGINPDFNKYTVKILKYMTGGGIRGNVGAHKLQYLSSSIPFIDGCDNPFPAEGGSDIETIDELKGRAAGLLKSLDRAVTPEDYEWLAKEATPAVGRSYCCKESNRFGEARIVIIPTSDSSAGYDFELMPSKELIKQVRNFLNERKVIGTSVSVEGPSYRKFNLKITVVFKSNYFDFEAEEAKITKEMQKFFHPLYGGEDGGGWGIMTSVTLAVILKKLEGIDSIQRVLNVTIYDIERSLAVEEIRMEEDEMPFMQEIEIEQRLG